MVLLGPTQTAAPSPRRCHSDPAPAPRTVVGAQHRDTSKPEVVSGSCKPNISCPQEIATLLMRKIPFLPPLPPQLTGNFTISPQSGKGNVCPVSTHIRLTYLIGFSFFLFLTQRIFINFLVSINLCSLLFLRGERKRDIHFLHSVGFKICFLKFILNIAGSRKKPPALALKPWHHFGRAESSARTDKIGSCLPPPSRRPCSPNPTPQIPPLPCKQLLHLPRPWKHPKYFK